MKHMHRQNTMMTEAGTAMMQLQAKEPQGLTITTRITKRQERILSESQREHCLAHILISDILSGTLRENIFVF